MGNVCRGCREPAHRGLATPLKKLPQSRYRTATSFNIDAQTLNWFVLAIMFFAGNSHAALRDPTQPGRSLTPATPDAVTAKADVTVNALVSYTVSGIWISDSQRRAIINGKTVHVGDSLDEESRVLSIQPGHVMILQRGIKQKLTLVPSLKTR